MKRTFLIAALAALGLGGCVAVPVNDGYGYDYYYAPYAPPAATFSFGYFYHDSDRGHRGGHRQHRHYRHRH